MARRRRTDEIETALRACGGNPTAAAQALGMSSQGVYQRIEREPHLQNVLKDIERTQLDICEAKILRAIHNDDLPTLRWYMERKGRERGWGSRTEVTGPEGGQLNLTLDVERLTDEQFALLEAVRASTGDSSEPRPKPRSRRRNPSAPRQK